MNKEKIRKSIGFFLILLGVAIASYGLGKHFTHKYCVKTYFDHVDPILNSYEEFKGEEKRKLRERFSVIGVSLSGWPSYYSGDVLRNFCGSGIVLMVSGLLLVFYNHLPSTKNLESFKLLKKKE